MQVKNYIAFGYPTKQVVNDLIRKRGFLNKENKRLPLANNALIEELLGDKGIICVEDIIQTLVECNDISLPFEDLRKVLWPI